jgi:hypothetical protein
MIDEMIVGGLVVETSSAELLEAFNAQADLMHAQSDLGAAAAAARSKMEPLVEQLSHTASSAAGMASEAASSILNSAAKAHP